MKKLFPAIFMLLFSYSSTGEGIKSNSAKFNANADGSYDIYTSSNQGSSSEDIFQEYNVSKSGVSIYNGEVENIIFRVDGPNISNLLGSTTVMDQSADFYLINPNGITCNGCSFQNISTAFLKSPEGEVTIEGKGLRADNSNVELVGKKIKIAGRVNVSGYLKLEADGEIEGISIDASAIGAMNAGNIFIKSTKDGAGVRLNQDMKSGGEVSVSSNGIIELRGDVESASNQIFVSKTTVNFQENQIKSGQDIRVFAKDKFINDKANIVTKGDILIAAKDFEAIGTISNNNGSKYWQGRFAAKGGIKIDVSNNIITNGLGLYTEAGDIIIKGHNLTSNFSNLPTIIYSNKDLKLDINETIVLKNSLIEVKGEGSITSGTINLAGKKVSTEEANKIIQTFSQGLSNHGKKILELSDIKIKAGFNVLPASESAQIIPAASNLFALGYIGAPVLKIELKKDLLIAGGKITGEELCIKARSLIMQVPQAWNSNNSGGIINANKQLNIAAGNIVANSGNNPKSINIIQSLGEVNIKVKNIVNTNSNIIAQNRLSVEANKILNIGTIQNGIITNGHIGANGELDLRVKDRLLNHNGLLIGHNDVKLDLGIAGTVVNKGGNIFGNENIYLTTGKLHNIGTDQNHASISAENYLSIKAGEIINHVGVIKSEVLDITSNSLVNIGKKVGDSYRVSSIVGKVVVKADITGVLNNINYASIAGKIVDLQAGSINNINDKNGANGALIKAQEKLLLNAKDTISNLYGGILSDGEMILSASSLLNEGYTFDISPVAVITPLPESQANTSGLESKEKGEEEGSKGQELSKEKGSTSYFNLSLLTNAGGSIVAPKIIATIGQGLVNKGGLIKGESIILEAKEIENTYSSIVPKAGAINIGGLISAEQNLSITSDKLINKGKTNYEEWQRAPKINANNHLQLMIRDKLINNYAHLQGQNSLFIDTVYLNNVGINISGIETGFAYANGSIGSISGPAVIIARREINNDGGIGSMKGDLNLSAPSINNNGVITSGAANININDSNVIANNGLISANQGLLNISCERLTNNSTTLGLQADKANIKVINLLNSGIIWFNDALINATQLTNADKGILKATNELHLLGKELINSGLIVSETDNITINAADSIVNKDNAVIAANKGTLSISGGRFVNSSNVQGLQADKGVIRVADLVNSGVIWFNDALINAIQLTNADKGILKATNELHLLGKELINSGLIVSDAANITINTADSIVNKDNAVIAANKGTLSISGGRFVNSANVQGLQADKGVIRVADLVNSGIIWFNNLLLSSPQVANFGTIKAEQDAVIVTSNFTHSGKLITSKDLSLIDKAIYNEAAGRVDWNKNAHLTLDHADNIHSPIIVSGKFNFYGKNYVYRNFTPNWFDNKVGSAVIFSLGGVTIDSLFLSGGDVTINSSGPLNITNGSIFLEQGTLNANVSEFNLYRTASSGAWQNADSPEFLFTGGNAQIEKSSIIAPSIFINSQGGNNIYGGRLNATGTSANSGIYLVAGTDNNFRFSQSFLPQTSLALNITPAKSVVTSNSNLTMQAGGKNISEGGYFKANRHLMRSSGGNLEIYDKQVSRVSGLSGGSTWGEGNFVVSNNAVFSNVNITVGVNSTMNQNSNILSGGVIIGDITRTIGSHTSSGSAHSTAQSITILNSTEMASGGNEYRAVSDFISTNSQINASNLAIHTGRDLFIAHSTLKSASDLIMQAGGNFSASSSTIEGGANLAIKANAITNLSGNVLSGNESVSISAKTGDISINNTEITGTSAAIMLRAASGNITNNNSSIIGRLVSIDSGRSYIQQGGLLDGTEVVEIKTKEGIEIIPLELHRRATYHAGRGATPREIVSRIFSEIRGGKIKMHTEGAVKFISALIQGLDVDITGSEIQLLSSFDTDQTFTDYGLIGIAQRYRDKDNIKVSTINATAAISLTASQGGIKLDASKLNAGDSLSLTAKGNIDIIPIKINETYENYRSNGYSKERSIRLLMADIASKNISIQSDQAVNIVSALVKAQNAEIDAAEINLLAESEVTEREEFTTSKKKYWHGSTKTTSTTTTSYKESPVAAILDIAEGLITKSTKTKDLSGNTNIVSAIIKADTWTAMSQDINITAARSINYHDNVTKTKYKGLHLSGGNLNIYSLKDQKQIDAHSKPVPTIVNVGGAFFGLAKGKFIALDADIESGSGDVVLSSPEGIVLDSTPVKDYKYVSVNKEGVGIGIKADGNKFAISIGAQKSKETDIVDKITFIASQIKGGDIDIRTEGNLYNRGGRIEGENVYIKARNQIHDSLYETISHVHKKMQQEAGFEIGIRTNLGSAIESTAALSEQKLSNEAEDLVNTGFAAYGAYIQWAKFIANPLTSGIWFVAEHREQTVTTDQTNAMPASIVARRAIEMDTREGKSTFVGTQISGGNLSLRSKELEMRAAVSSGSQDITKQQISGSVGPDGVNLALATTDATSSYKRHTYANINMLGDVYIDITERAELRGANIEGKQIAIKAGELLLETLLDESSSNSDSVSLGIGLTANEKNSLMAIPNVGARIERGDNSWVGEVASIIGHEKTTLIVGRTLELVGSRVASAQRRSDGSFTENGALQIKVGELILKNISQYDNGKTLGGAIKYAEARNKGIFGNDYQAAFAYHNVEGIVKATIGAGEIEVAGVNKTHQELGVNQDINRAEVITRNKRIKEVNVNYTSVNYDALSDRLNNTTMVERVKEGFEPLVQKLSEITGNNQELKEQAREVKLATEDVAEAIVKGEISPDMATEAVEYVSEQRIIAQKLQVIKNYYGSKGQEIPVEVVLAILENNATPVVSGNSLKLKGENLTIKSGVAAGDYGASFQLEVLLSEDMQKGFDNSTENLKKLAGLILTLSAKYEYYAEKHPTLIAATLPTLNVLLHSAGGAIAGSVGGPLGTGTGALYGTGKGIASEVIGHGVNYAVGDQVGAIIREGIEIGARKIKALNPELTDAEAGALASGSVLLAMSAQYGSGVIKPVTSGIREFTARKAAASGVTASSTSIAGTHLFESSNKGSGGKGENTLNKYKDNSNIYSSTPVGRSGRDLKIIGQQNMPAKVGNLEYTGHALDQMQRRGFTPTVVEHTIGNVTPITGKNKGTIVFFDKTNNMTVVLDEATKKVITIFRGKGGI